MRSFTNSVPVSPKVTLLREEYSSTSTAGYVLRKLAPGTWYLAVPGIGAWAADSLDYNLPTTYYKR